MAELASKLSEALTQALTDLEACETDETYVIDQSVWHAWNAESQRCAVCLAGATMAKTLGVPSHAVADFGKSPVHENYAMLDRLDDIQRGRVADAIRKAPEPHEADGWAVSVLSKGKDAGWLAANGYVANPDQFKDAVRKIAAQLAEAGL